MTLVHGLLNLSWWGTLIATLILTQITIAGVTLYLHRYQAHRGLELHPIVSHFFRFWLWVTTSMVTKEWVAIHRKHHAKCETELDPHSPQIYGIRKVLLEGAELYGSEKVKAETIERYGRGTPDDWIERNVYSTHQQLGIILMLITDLLLFGVLGLTVWAVQMLWIPFFAAGVINGIGHYWGYRSFECPDAAARNIIPLAVFIGGEELHNNHHTFPNSAKLSVKWWEVDIGWMYITLLKAMKLAKVYKVPPKLKAISGKTKDAEGAADLVTYRFEILARYSKDVILPVLREERDKAGDAKREEFHKAKALLIQADILMDTGKKNRLAQLLANHHTLQQVYQYRLKLQDVWERTTTTPRELLEALQEWCKQAETAGIEALREFSKRLRIYVPQTATSI